MAKFLKQLLQIPCLVSIQIRNLALQFQTLLEKVKYIIPLYFPNYQFLQEHILKTLKNYSMHVSLNHLFQIKFLSFLHKCKVH